MKNEKILKPASLAVFKELYNSGKDIYDVIAKFIEAVISDKNFESTKKRKRGEQNNDV